ncbi:ATP-binding cassette subfamily B protein [Aminivibrio pyruvatiphilus]|uniref:ATP-binding cassette subfamily B protein n=1 Tax=Aminivibrio pyruvatiphilus TaxID=1005740 RepID=A0A4R8M158_9BACT|nr:peptidase domain-containing ABC transporter [Aminivibrio pyruvatiphilus]TDY53189.1 ATP-binding cassette subfamily B protein [Aminivibrio pyruvatiphilus]
MIFRKSFPFCRQRDMMDCGPACLQMICRHFGRSFSLPYLREKSEAGRDGTSFGSLRRAGEALGLRGRCLRVSFSCLEEEALLPCIVPWDRNHFVVLWKTGNGKMHIMDPADGERVVDCGEFRSRWSGGEDEGFLLFFEPAERFRSHREPEREKEKNMLSLAPLMAPYVRLLASIGLAMLLTSAIQMTLPFLTRIAVDRGIGTGDITILKAVFLGQALLVSGRTCAHFFREWALFFVSTPVNINLVRAFLEKLAHLPLRYFDVKKLGDILQRLQDHNRVESFLSRSILGILMAALNVAVYGIVLFFYSRATFFVFLAGTILYVLWARLFLSARRRIDYQKFLWMGRSQDAVIQFVMGMQDIRLNQCEEKKTDAWHSLQEKLAGAKRRGLAIGQGQLLGCSLIREAQYVLISYLAARSVLDGDITLGTMLGIQFILGQLGGPVDFLFHFFTEAQDASVSFERIQSVRSLPDEEDEGGERNGEISPSGDVILKNVSFRYGGENTGNALDSVSIAVRNGMTTAVVGESGCGKTTFLKLLLGIYRPSEGEIYLGTVPLSSIPPGEWRRCCGAVMQDGYIFSDTISANIALSGDEPDQEDVRKAARMANIEEFIESLPQKYETLIGNDGHGLSQGQRQRILIARAIYKNPGFLFFDEATNALDAGNESVIMGNLRSFFEGKTVVIAAHRLSTVKNADQIVVLEGGRVVEQGTHSELVSAGGKYYALVGGQMEPR